MDSACICRIDLATRRRWINTGCRAHGVASAADAPSPADRPDAPADLTPREFELLGLISQGLSNPAIAKKLWVTEDTVKTHLRRIFTKLGATNRAHAVTRGFHRGLLTVPTGPAPSVTGLAQLAAREATSAPSEGDPHA